MNDVAKRILSLAESRKISDQELCRLLNSKKDKVYSWKIDRSKPTAEEVAIIANHLKVSTDFLLGRVDTNAPKIYDCGADLSENAANQNGQPLAPEISKLLDAVQGITEHEAELILHHIEFVKSQRNKEPQKPRQA